MASQGMTIPPDGGWGYAIMMSSFFVAFLSDGIGNSYGLLLPILVDTFKTSVPVASLPAGLFTGFFLLTGPVTARLTQRFGCRPVAFLGGLITACSMAVAAFSVNMEMFIVFYGVFAGIGIGLIYLPSITMVNAYFERKRAMVVGVVTCGSGVGLLIMAFLIDHLIGVYGWRGCYLIMAAFFLNLCVCASLLRPLHPVEAEVVKSDSDDRVATTESNNSEDKELVTDEKLCLNGVKDGNEVQLLSLKPNMIGGRNSSSSSFAKQQQLEAAENYHATATGARLMEIDQESNTDKTTDDSINPSNSSQADYLLKLIKCHTDSSFDSINRDLVRLDDPRGLESKGLTHLSDNSSHQLSSTSDTRLGSFSGNKAPVNFAGGQNAIDIPKDLSKTFSKTPASVQNLRNPRAHSSTGSLVYPVTSTTWLEPSVTSSTIETQHHQSAFSNSYDDDVRLYTHQHRQHPHQVTRSMLMLNQPIELMAGSSLSLVSIASRRTMESISITELHQLNHSETTLSSPKLLVRDPVFILFCLGASLVQIATTLPGMFTPSYALSIGLSSSQAATIVSILGISNTVGRFLAGYMSFLGLGSIRIYNTGILLTGTACMLVQLCTNYVSLLVFATACGFLMGAVPPLQSVILVELLGIERLPSSFGVMCFCKSISCMTGPFIAGSMYEVTQDYLITFVFAGFMFLCAGLLHVIMVMLRRHICTQCPSNKLPCAT